MWPQLIQSSQTSQKNKNNFPRYGIDSIVCSWPHIFKTIGSLPSFAIAIFALWTLSQQNFSWEQTTPHMRFLKFTSCKPQDLADSSSLLCRTCRRFRLGHFGRRLSGWPNRWPSCLGIWTLHVGKQKKTIIHAYMLFRNNGILHEFHGIGRLG